MGDCATFNGNIPDFNPNVDDNFYINHWLKRFAEDHLVLIVNSKELHKIKGKILQPSDMKLLLIQDLSIEESLFSESVSIYEIKRSKCGNISDVSKESKKSSYKEPKFDMKSTKVINKKIEKSVYLSPIKRADSPVSMRNRLHPPKIEHRMSLKSSISVNIV